MAGTQIIQHRRTITVEGTNLFEISAICRVAGDLPDTGVFLLNIDQVNDPKNDTLVRIVTVGDFSEYKTSRSKAIDAGDSRWRSSSFTLQYDDIETANEAWKELSSRVNALVKQYDDFSEEFETNSEGQVTVYPAVDQGTVNQLKDAYKATLEPLEEAKKERDEHIQECSEKEKKLETTEERLQEAREDLETASSIQSSLSASTPVLSSSHSGIHAAKDAIRSTNSSSDASDTDQDSIESEIRNIEAQLVSFNTENGNLSSLLGGSVSSLVSSLQSRVSSLASEKNKLLSELNKCHLKSSKLEAKVDAAREARDAALASVREACPDFTP